ncbi:MAG: hypothetical protein ACOYO0_09990 [Sandarakinorhabdus sp.]
MRLIVAAVMMMTSAAALAAPLAYPATEIGAEVEARHGISV